MIDTITERAVDSNSSRNRESRRILLDEASNEFVFAVVGHAGSGTTAVAKQLSNLLLQTSVGKDQFDVEILKARAVIENWARKRTRIHETRC